MKKSTSYHLEIEIDRLTNSVQNTISGDSFATDVFEIDKVDLKTVHILKFKTMGYIKEPTNFDLNVGPMPFSDEDRREISAIIAQYKSTGEIPKPTRTIKSKIKETVIVAGGTRKMVKSKVEKKKSTVSESDKL